MQSLTLDTMASILHETDEQALPKATSHTIHGLLPSHNTFKGCIDLHTKVACYSIPRYFTTLLGLLIRGLGIAGLARSSDLAGRNGGQRRPAYGSGSSLSLRCCVFALGRSVVTVRCWSLVIVSLAFRAGLHQRGLLGVLLLFSVLGSLLRSPRCSRPVSRLRVAVTATDDDRVFESVVDRSLQAVDPVGKVRLYLKGGRRRELLFQSAFIEAH